MIAIPDDLQTACDSVELTPEQLLREIAHWRIGGCECRDKIFELKHPRLERWDYAEMARWQAMADECKVIVGRLVKLAQDAGVDPYGGDEGDCNDVEGE